MKRSKFNLSFTKLLSCDMGELVPCGLTEVLPGDSMQMNTSALIRCSPLLAPVMHPVDVRIHHWFVPHRLVWDDWEKDYFTSARPWEQKGASITVPMGGTAPVMGLGPTGVVPGSIQAGVSVRETTPLASPRAYAFSRDMAAGQFQMELDSDVEASAKPLIYADLSASTGVSVNALRASMALQRFQEARARYGSRYVEYLAALGVRSSDARLNRPEYLGGGKERIQFSEVLATAETGASVDVGDMKGHGIAALRSNRFRSFFEEHGYIHTFMSIKPKTIYANGLFRHWNRRTKTDYWQKELEHIGQQSVLRKEVYAAAASPDGVFGWQDRYDEYRRAESLISGEFRSTLLDFWHMARIFASEPTLNATFVSAVPTERVFAVPSQDVIYVHARHNVQSRRLVSAKGNSFLF